MDGLPYRQNLKHWAQTLKLGGLFVTGKQGEFFSMSVPERKRSFELATLGVIDALEWYCAKCGGLVHRSELQLQSIVEDLPRVYGQFYDSPPEARICPACGTVHPGHNWKSWHEMRASFPVSTNKIGL